MALLDAFHASFRFREFIFLAMRLGHLPQHYRADEAAASSGHAFERVKQLLLSLSLFITFYLMPPLSKPPNIFSRFENYGRLAYFTFDFPALLADRLTTRLLLHFRPYAYRASLNNGTLIISLFLASIFIDDFRRSTLHYCRYFSSLYRILRHKRPSRCITLRMVILRYGFRWIVS